MERNKPHSLIDLDDPDPEHDHATTRLSTAVRDLLLDIIDEDGHPHTEVRFTLRDNGDIAVKRLTDVNGVRIPERPSLTEAALNRYSTGHVQTHPLDELLVALLDYRCGYTADNNRDLIPDGLATAGEELALQYHYQWLQAYLMGTDPPTADACWGDMTGISEDLQRFVTDGRAYAARLEAERHTPTPTTD